MNRQLNIEARDHEQLTIIELRGHLVQTEVHKLKSRLEEVLNDNRRHVIVDLSHTQFIDSSGIGALVHARSECNRLEGAAAIVFPCQKAIRGALVAASIDRVISCYDNLQTALDAFCASHGLDNPQPESPPAAVGDVNTDALMMVRMVIEQMARRMDSVDGRLLGIESQLQQINSQRAARDVAPTASSSS